MRQIDRHLGELDAQVDSGTSQFWRTLKLTAGSIVMVASIILAPPTGGASAFAAGAGLLLWADGLREDAALSNRSREATAEIGRLLAETAEIETELQRRGIR